MLYWSLILCLDLLHLNIREPQESSLTPVEWMFANPKLHRYEQGKHYSINANAIRILQSKSLHSYIQIPGLASQARWRHIRMKYNLFVIASFPECSQSDTPIKKLND